jgi:hypothetical protein
LVVQVLRLGDGPVVLVLLAAVLVGRETTLLCRLVGEASVDQGVTSIYICIQTCNSFLPS